MGARRVGSRAARAGLMAAVAAVVGGTLVLPAHAAPSPPQAPSPEAVAAEAAGVGDGGGPAADTLATGTAPEVVGPDAYPSGNVTVTGHGYGHGRGMGQWGAYGYATIYDWPHERILNHYYGGTYLGTTTNQVIGVRLIYRDGLDLVVTSGRDFTVDNVLIKGGAAARVQLRADGQFNVYPRTSCSGTESPAQVRPGSKVTSTVATPGTDLGAMLAICSGGDTVQYRGTLTLAQYAGSPRTVNDVLMEDYLRSVVPRESPASWADSGGAAALRAQAVAARSYAYGENRYDYAETCDTTSCQVYSGAGRNRSSQEDYRSDAAVTATANQVRRTNGSGVVARTEFSSSTGGWTAGGVFPAIADDGDTVSPYHDWSTNISVTSIQNAYGIGTLQSISVTQRNGLGEDGGRAQKVRVVGSGRTVEMSGDDFRLDWGLRSDWYSFAPVSQPPQPPPSGPSRPLTWYLSDSNAAGPATTTFSYGQTGDQVLSCDWDGDGDDTAGIFRAGFFYLRNSNSAGAHDIRLAFGNPTDRALCGDWDNDGDDSIGVWRNGTLFLRFSNSDGPHDITASYGGVGDTPVMADWNGDGYDTIGLFRDGRWSVSDSNRYPVTSYSFAFGQAGDRPLGGDWTGDDTAGPGVRRGINYYLNTDLDGSASEATFAFGNGSDLTVAGDFNGDGLSTVAVVRAS